MLDVVNKLLNTKSLLTMPSNVLPLHLKQTFLLIIWIFNEGEGDGMESRLPFKIFTTLLLKYQLNSPHEKLHNSESTNWFRRFKIHLSKSTVQRSIEVTMKKVIKWWDMTFFSIPANVRLRFFTQWANFVPLLFWNWAVIICSVKNWEKH